MSGNSTRGVWIEDLAWPEVARRIEAGSTVIVPIGARAKEHGHHLPMKTDYLVARALAQGVAERLSVLIAPVVDIGYYPAFVNYPGSQSLSAATFVAMLNEVFAGLIRQGARRIAVINTGVSTEATVWLVAREILEQTGVRIAVAHIRDLAREVHKSMDQKLGGHADEFETSLVLAIDASVVHLDRAVEDYGNQLGQPTTVFSEPTIFNPDPASGLDYSQNGARGDPTLATVQKGQLILATMIDELVDGIRLLEARS